MKINKATYGTFDCTSIIQSKVINDKLFIMVDNNIVGDPEIGKVKYLTIEGELNGNPFKEVIQEGTLYSFPKPTVKKLGIFYSNNTNPLIHNAINKSLESIKVASKDKADIITCMWQKQPGNPFTEIISWYKSFSHLNQLLQIMQCLYTAKEIGQYDYVSFLEHDVLYPEGYFDYPDFNNGEMITNMNYGGICKEGWQNRKQDDQPFHQITMRLDDAIAHCIEILPNALKTNSGMIESQTRKRLTWAAPNQAMHINHGHHFTSHNSIYDRSNIYTDHSYWGNYQKYLSMFV